MKTPETDQLVATPSCNRPKIYLAGAMTGVSKKQVLSQRRGATLALNRAGFDVFDPATLEQSPSTTGVFSKKIPLKQMRIFVKKEKEAIQTCQGVLLLTGTKSSDGAWTEMNYAKYSLKLPVVVVSRKRLNGNLVGWVNVEADALVGSYRQAALKFQKLLDVDQFECQSCHQFKLLGAFHPGAIKASHYICKLCQNKKGQKKRLQDGGESHRRRSRTWRLKNPVLGRYISLKHDAKARRVPFTLVKDQFLYWYGTQPLQCWYCTLYEQENIQVFGRQLEIDRQDNSLGYTQGNIVLACGLCNRSKSNLFTAIDWKAIATKYVKPRVEQWRQHLIPSLLIETQCI